MTFATVSSSLRAGVSIHTSIQEVTTIPILSRLHSCFNPHFHTGSDEKRLEDLYSDNVSIHTSIQEVTAKLHNFSNPKLCFSTIFYTISINITTHYPPSTLFISLFVTVYQVRISRGFYVHFPFAPDIHFLFLVKSRSAFFPHRFLSISSSALGRILIKL